MQWEWNETVKLFHYISEQASWSAATGHTHSSFLLFEKDLGQIKDNQWLKREAKSRRCTTPTKWCKATENCDKYTTNGCFEAFWVNVSSVRPTCLTDSEELLDWAAVVWVWRDWRAKCCLNVEIWSKLQSCCWLMRLSSCSSNLIRMGLIKGKPS